MKQWHPDPYIRQCQLNIIWSEGMTGEPSLYHNMSDDDLEKLVKSEYVPGPRLDISGLDNEQKKTAYSIMEIITDEPVPGQEITDQIEGANFAHVRETMLVLESAGYVARVKDPEQDKHLLWRKAERIEEKEAA